MNPAAWQLHLENIRLRHELKLLRNEVNRQRLRADLATVRLQRRLARTTKPQHHAQQPSERTTMETEPTTPTEPEPTDPTPDTGGEEGDNE